MSYFPAPQQLCGAHSRGKRARKVHFHGHEHTCTHTRRQSAQTSTLAPPKSKPGTCLIFCAVSRARTTTTRLGPTAGRAKSRGRHGSFPHCAHRWPNFNCDRSEARRHGAAHAALPPGWRVRAERVCACWSAPDGFAARQRRGGTQGAARPSAGVELADGVIEAVAPASRALTMHGAVTHDPKRVQLSSDSIVFVRTSMEIPANPGTCEPWHCSTGKPAGKRVCLPRQTDSAQDTECARTRYVYSMQVCVCVEYAGGAGCCSLSFSLPRSIPDPFSPACPWLPGSPWRRRPRMGAAAHVTPYPWSHPW